MNNRPNILVVCGRNKRRSRTAEFIFKNDSRFNIRSVGLSPSSDRKISEKDLLWADLVLVMENNQKSKLQTLYPQVKIKNLGILQIPDDYEFMQPDLVEMLTERINEAFDSLEL